MSTAEHAIRRAWQQVAGRGRDTVIDDVLARLREPQRRYHTATHVMWVLRHVDELLADPSTTLPASAVDQHAAIRAAAIFHDVVYDASSTTNEADSARLAERVLAPIGWSAATCELVTSMILDTATHVARTPSAQILIDADLAILGADPAGYQGYVNGVRAEYAHVDDAAWRAGRAAVLRRFLERDEIFVTPAGRERWERRARANLSAELVSLTGAARPAP